MTRRHADDELIGSGKLVVAVWPDSGPPVANDPADYAIDWRPGGQRRGERYRQRKAGRDLSRAEGRAVEGDLLMEQISAAHGNAVARVEENADMPADVRSRAAHIHIRKIGSARDAERGECQGRSGDGLRRGSTRRRSSRLVCVMSMPPPTMKWSASRTAIVGCT